MVPQLALVDWVALVIAAVLLAAVGAALVIAWIASRHKRKVDRISTPGRQGRTVVRRATSERAKVIDMLPQEPTEVVEPENGTRPPIPETRPNSLLDAPASAKAPVLANGVAGHGFALRQPGFFEDPIGRHEQRYWDGSRWTEYVKEEGQRFIDPL